MSHVDDGTLHAYLDGELGPAEAQGVTAHVAQCPSCRTRLDEERALIARADELLGLTAPPDRQIPPFRGGDPKPPARLWWQVRLPLAWAATVALALGVGMYVGSGSLGLAPPAADSSSDLAGTGVPMPPAYNDTVAGHPPEPRPLPLSAGRERGAAAPPVERKQADAAGTPAVATRGETTPAWRVPDELSARAYAQARAGVAKVVARDAYAQIGPPLTLDSARALLGAAPLAVPGLPVQGIHQARRIGYSAVVVVEQALDSTTIDVISARPSSLTVEAVVVAGGARPDSASPAERALPGRAAPAADSIAAIARKADAPPVRVRGAAANEPAAGLVGEVRGPLSADSLAALRRRLQPLRP